MFSCEYCEIFKNTYFEKHLRTNAPEMSAGNIYNAQQTFKELFRKLAKVKTQSGRDLMCFGLWQLKIPFSACCTNFSTRLCKSAYIYTFSNVKTNIVPFDYQLKKKKFEKKLKKFHIKYKAITWVSQLGATVLSGKYMGHWWRLTFLFE